MGLVRSTCLKFDMAFLMFRDARFAYFSMTVFMSSTVMVASHCPGRRRCFARNSLLAAMAMEEFVADSVRSTCSPINDMIVLSDSLSSSPAFRVAVLVPLVSRRL